MASSPTVEQRAARLAGKNISYTLKRSNKRRSIGLRVDDSGLTVSVPVRATEKWLHSVLQDKAHWVIEKLENWQSQKPLVTQWVDGELIPYFGEQIMLRLVQSLFPAPVTLRGENLFVFVADGDDANKIERTVTLWYRQEALQLFEKRVAYYAPLLGVTPCAVKLSAARTQWGCCTARGSVRLNVQLIKLPLRLIDYVVVHELAHMREMNHSARFWNVVKSVCPDYAKLRRELKTVAL
jgi:hypothetical protein